MKPINLESISNNSKDFKHKTIMVTGAADGIGRVISLTLADLGATIILLDKNSLGLNSAYDEIQKLKKQTPVIVLQDLNLLTQQNCNTLQTQISQTFGHLDGIIHCAVETGNLSPLEHYSHDDWSKVLRTNLHSPYLLTRSLLPLMNNQASQSHVIFSVSEQALQATAFWGAYAVASQGVKALVEIWSQETRNSSTSISLLDPGKVKTAFLTRLYPGLNPEHYCDPLIIANAYCYLFSQAKKTLHGQFFQVKDCSLSVVKFAFNKTD